VPEAAVVALLMDGFCSEEAKLFGPLQLYVAPATVGVASVKVWPTQIGPLLDALGVAGAGLIVATVVPGAEGQPLTVIVTS
jgi:hypothetical protein